MVLILLVVAISVLMLGSKNSEKNNSNEVFERELNDYTTKIKRSDRITEPIYSFYYPIKPKKKKKKKKNNEIVKDKVESPYIEKRKNKEKLKEEKIEIFKDLPEETNMKFNSDKGETLIIPRSLDDNFESFVENQKSLENMRPKNDQQDADIWYNKNINFINACIAEAYSKNKTALITKEILPNKESWGYIMNKIINDSNGELKISISNDGILITINI